MSMLSRLLIALGILLSHLIIFFPMAELFLAYIIIFNPIWFREFLKNLDEPAMEKSE